MGETEWRCDMSFIDSLPFPGMNAPQTAGVTMRLAQAKFAAFLTSTRALGDGSLPLTAKTTKTI